MRRARRVLGFAAIALAVVAVAVVLFLQGGGYEVTARFQNASQLVPGNPVQAGGVQIGSVKRIELSDDGRADVTLSIDEPAYEPLPRGTQAKVHLFSLSGIANRYVDLQFPGGLSGPTISNGGMIEADATSAQVDLDQMTNMLDRPTRRGLRTVLRGQAAALDGRGAELQRGFHYLNPALVTTDRLVVELVRDRPLLEGMLTDGSRLLAALDERRTDLAALVGNLRDVNRAFANRRRELGESIGRLPAFMRRANTTFVNVRAALDDVDPLVAAAGPVARKLGPVLAESRALASGARPALADLRVALRRPKGGNDLIEYLDSLPRLADAAVVTRRRSVAPGGRRVSVGEVRGALPESVDALAGATPVIALGRPYTLDLLGWFDDFSTTGAYFDAFGGIARAHLNFTEGGEGGPPKQGQFKRCPGGADVVAPDGSNLLSEREREELDCLEEHRALR
jgi:phospholipid/cholesterol/gamma-HCH transport system substrate-binding protein